MSNRLGAAASAYLKSAAHQPVDWYPWGAEAFARAEAERKPILLDIGAVWCHWCHVMDGESYEDPDVAAQLNRDWVCIKVDRDERPDVDARYQRAVQALTGQGGWPLTAFLTPAGDVFYGGTYFPPDDSHGRPSLTKVLTELAAVYKRHPDRVTTQAAEIRKHLADHLAESKPGPVRQQDLDKAADTMARVFDFRNGGFGSAPKFPHPGALEFLLARWFDQREDWAADIVRKTLVAMAKGGIYDQIGGGFHRYSTDARWIVPHFEKMSYDNSELLKAYAHAMVAAEFGAWDHDDPGAWYDRTIRGTVEWMQNTMSDPAGGYFASQDADAGANDDGDYFTWTAAEARAVLTPDEFAAVELYYDVGETGEMHHDPAKNVLWVAVELVEAAKTLNIPPWEVDQRLTSAREKLQAARVKRVAPFVDRTVYTAWNAMMASAMLDVSVLPQEYEVESHALTTMERLFVEATSDDGAGGARHAIGSEVTGLLDDQVQLAAASLDAYEATGERRWLERAVRLMDHTWDHYRTVSGGFRDTPPNPTAHGYLDQPVIPVHDAPTPSPNGVAAINLARLAAHTSDPRWTERRDRVLAGLAGGAAEMSLHGATLLRAIDWALNPITQVVIVGHPDDAVVKEMRRGARLIYRPRKVITHLEPGMTLDYASPELRAALDGKAPRAYVCAGSQCSLPAETAADLFKSLETFGIGTK